MNFKNTKLIVGAGFSGAVIAREFAEAGHKCLVIDQRDHIGGNCHTARDADTGVMEHIYGPHIFNTNNEHVWKYVNRFGEFRPFVNRVKASIAQGLFSLPINLNTINQFFGLNLSSLEAMAFLEKKAEKTILAPQNFEEHALKHMGRELYEAFFKDYTVKQWGCEPRELPASILKRVPIRFNHDDNYYNSKYQGIPAEGYTRVVERILDHPNIEIKLSTPFEKSMRQDFSHTFYTGPLDAYYGHSEGRLGYRTVFWEKTSTDGNFQDHAVINYPGADVAHTRVHEHKHFTPWERHEKTIVLTEFSKETKVGDIPYYPKKRHADKLLLNAYLHKARQEENVSFLGRLATYRYMDMHHVIDEALAFSKRYLSWETNPSLPKPKFGNDNEF